MGYPYITLSRLQIIDGTGTYTQAITFLTGQVFPNRKSNLDKDNIGKLTIDIAKIVMWATRHTCLPVITVGAPFTVILTFRVAVHSLLYSFQLCSPFLV